VFLFAFCWQWTDDFYVGLLNTGIETSNQLLVDLVGAVPPSLKLGYAGQSLYETAIRNTCGLMIIAPLVILYAFCQNFLVQGIEHSGIAN
jgi:multiple sugar transport system permease protein